MKERPMLFNGSMVRSVLDDSKTQTRRVVKGAEKWPAKAVRAVVLETRGTAMAVDAQRCTYGPEIKCPYGQPGDRLWVREAWRTLDVHDHIPPREMNAAYRLWFEADAHHQPGFGKLRPSMFMPRWASRITLEIVSVRVERLQSISEADAKAEGLFRFEYGGQVSWRDYSLSDEWAAVSPMLENPIDSYRTLWESINNPGSWAANPWVWVVEFKREDGAE